MANNRTPLSEDKWQLFEDLCGIMCTIQEICSILRIPEKVLDRHIQEKFTCSLIDLHKTLSDTGKISLRRHQMQISKTNASMAIWLGKVYLDQRDKDADDRDRDRCLGILDHIKQLKIADAKE